VPAEVLRAFARMQLSAVVARWHLAYRHPTGWPGFIALGPTRTGKTSIASFVCRVYGVEEVRAIKVAQHETPGSLLARRQRDRASPTGYRLERSPVLELAYVCIDEYDKAPREVKTAAGGLLLGNSQFELEGELVTVRPTAYVTLNSGPDGLDALHEAYVRRSVVIDTGQLRPLLGDVDLAIARLFAGEVVIPRLSLARIKPPAPTLPAELWRLLRDELRAGLTDHGWDRSDVEPLARIALGRAALNGRSLDEQAVLATVLDYLTCAATLGHTRPGFAGRLAPRLGARGALVPDAAAAEAESEQRQAVEHDRRRRSAAARLEFEWVRERAAGGLLDARDAMGRARDPDRQALARALTIAAEQIRSARSIEALRAAIHAAVPYEDQARTWKAARDQQAAERERVAEQGRQQRELDRASRQRERERALLPVAAGIVEVLEPLTRHGSARPEAGRCPSCGIVYTLQATFGRLEKCTACDQRLIPVRSRANGYRQ